MKKLIILIPLLFYLFASYNFEKIKQFNNILDISFLENNPDENLLELYTEQNKNITDIIGINTSGFVDVLEKDNNRTNEAKLLKVFGNPEKISPKEDIL